MNILEFLKAGKQGGIIMSDSNEISNKSLDPAVRRMIAKAEQMEVSTVWD